MLYMTYETVIGVLFMAIVVFLLYKMLSKFHKAHVIPREEVRKKINIMQAKRRLAREPLLTGKQIVALLEEWKAEELYFNGE